ncbi:family 1 glycosylhydrolase [Zhihengliuella halotolerans]|uniref:family 1 glycosylhydrolase n=1 Tax=Zhihengliuella halotolerans TaxID=370736 RepID=UPI000C80051F|nr:family 1 glycosylhydrolase [Zhihengliuella halotolerans]
MTELHTPALPADFLWGVATAGHQNEGQNTTSDTWTLEHTRPTIFREPSGAGCRAWEKWEEDLELVADMGLTAYRFSIEWARIEPVEGEFSTAALDHYEAVVDGCRRRGLAPLVTFSHFTAPHWFAAKGAWLAVDAPTLFARFCGVVADRIADKITLAVTLNEPNLEQVLLAAGTIPPAFQDRKREMLEAAARDAGTATYRSANVILPEEQEAFRDGFTAAHRAAKAALKARRADLPVGFSIAISDEHALTGGEESRDARRATVYDYWLHLAREDDFMGVQNYERTVHGPDGPVAPGPDAVVNDMGSEVAPQSLAEAVAYAHEVAGVPILVSEHGMATGDDTHRAAFIGPALDALAAVAAGGVPVIGYCHWTLMDNFEWIFGYGMQLGLHEVDRETFERTPKASAGVYRDVVARYRAGAASAAPVAG